MSVSLPFLFRSNETTATLDSSGLCRNVFDLTLRAYDAMCETCNKKAKHMVIILDHDMSTKKTRSYHKTGFKEKEVQV
jgi:hypothetical protein